MRVHDPKGFDKEEWLARSLRERTVNRNLNAIVALIGATGSGKSYSAMRLGLLIDPSFGIDRIVFTKDAFLDLVSQGLPKGTVIMWDEAGLGLPAREWQSVMNRAVGYILQTFRYKNYVLLLTVPSQMMLDSQARALFHILLECQGVQIGPDAVLTKPFLVSHGRDGKPYEKYPVLLFDNGPMQVRGILFGRPAPALVDAYEAKRRAHLDSYYRSLRDQWRGAAAHDGIPEWAYRGLLVASDPCPGCKHRRTQAEIGALVGLARESVNRNLAKARTIAEKIAARGGPDEPPAVTSTQKPSLRG